MLMLRLQRMGKPKNPSYRLVVSEKNKDPQAGSLEILGIYDPSKTPKIVELKKERINYWLSVGAKASNTLNNLLINEGVVTGKKMKSVSLSKERRVKLGAKKAEVEKAKADAVAKEVEAEKAKAELAVKEAEAKKQAEEAKAEPAPAVESAEPKTEEAPAV